MSPDTDADPTREDAAPAGSESAALQAERDELLAQLQRARADYQNLRRRTQLDIDNALRRSLEPLLQGLLVVLDHLDLALASSAEGDEARALAQGVEMTRRQFLHALAQEGVTPMDDVREFDPTLHEAVSTCETSEQPPGQIVRVLRRGWNWRGQVLRAAHVQVSAAPKTDAS